VYAAAVWGVYSRSRQGTQVTSGPIAIDVVARVRLYISSYSPLFVLMALRLHAHLWLVAGCLVVSGLGFLTLWQASHEAQNMEPRQEVTLEDVEDRGSDVAGYLVTYLLPFLTIADPGAYDVLAYLTFIALVGFIYIQSDMIHINPVLYAFGYRVLAVTTSDGERAILITNDPPSPRTKITPTEVRDHLWISRK
jgi:hypothetical protein